jgi:hypothetical protein
MAFTASLLMTRAGLVLQDTAKVRWTESELISWINEGVRAVVVRRPDAGASTQNFTLANGTKQTLAADIYRLIDVVRNMGAGGATPGNAVRLVERELLDNAADGWHAETAAAVTRQYVYDGQADPNTFYVYPAGIAGNQLEVIVSKIPTDVSAGSDSVAIHDAFEEAVLNFVLFRAFSKDSQYANGAMAAAHYAAFKDALGATTA